MKKLFAALLVLALAFTGCAMAETLSVIATPSPHAEVVRLIEEDLAAAGYELELIEVTDYVTENPAVAGGDVMINFFQHIPYLDGYNASVSEEEQLAAVIPTHFEPMGIYPGTKTSLDEIAEGDAIAVPNDPTNMTRAFLLLADAGLISVPEGTTLESTVTPDDITGDLNPTALSSTRPTRSSSPACAATWPSPSSTATTPPSPASTPTPTPPTPRPRKASPASPTSTSSPSSRRTPRRTSSRRWRAASTPRRSTTSSSSAASCPPSPWKRPNKPRIPLRPPRVLRGDAFAWDAKANKPRRKMLHNDKSSMPAAGSSTTTFIQSMAAMCWSIPGMRARFRAF